MKRRGPVRTRQHEPASGPIEVRHLERRLDGYAILRPDAPEKAERLVITAEQHVLAVVDELAGDTIAERGGAAAERTARLEHDDALARFRQRARGGEAGDSAADDRYIKFSGRHR